MSKRSLLDKILHYCSGNEEDPLFRAFCEVPRERFVPEKDDSFAYMDTPLPIGYGQTISQPTMIYMMLREMELQPHDKVLEIGTGSGYHASLLSRVAGEVHTVERIPQLAERAEQVIEELGYDNIHVHVGDGTLGLAEKSPFDKIIVTAGAPTVPEELKQQLTVGGILVIPVGDLYLQRLLKVVRKGEEEYEEFSKGGCMFVKLIGKKGWQESFDDRE